MFDDCPDLSYLGKYSNEYERGAINRKAVGDMGRNEYQYFIPANEHYRFEDYKRYEAYNNRTQHNQHGNKQQFTRYNKTNVL